MVMRCRLARTGTLDIKGNLAAAEPLLLYGGGPGDQVGFYSRCQGELLGLWDLSGTLKIVIYVENYPQKRSFRLADYHTLWVGGC